MNSQRLCLLISLVAFAASAPRLPAPIQEIPERPTPAPEQSAKTKHKETKPSEKTANALIRRQIASQSAKNHGAPAARIKGVVKDSRGQPVAGAEVHIQSKDGTAWKKIVRTDSNGQYGVGNLPRTHYEVILFVNGQVKATVNNMKPLDGKPSQLDFKLTGQ